jgi:hypothetical protein
MYLCADGLPFVFALVLVESISKRGLANEVNGLSSFGSQWKSLKTEDAKGLPTRDRGRTVRISPRFEMLSLIFP